MSTASEPPLDPPAPEEVDGPLLRDPPPPPGWVDPLDGSRALEDPASPVEPHPTAQEPAAEGSSGNGSG